MLQRKRDELVPELSERWCIPGGKVDKGDFDIRATAQRELFEETGIQEAVDFVADVPSSDGRYKFSLFACGLSWRPKIKLEFVDNAEGRQESPFCGYGWFNVEQCASLSALEPALFAWQALTGLTVAPKSVTPVTPLASKVKIAPKGYQPKQRRGPDVRD